MFLFFIEKLCNTKCFSLSSVPYFCILTPVSRVEIFSGVEEYVLVCGIFSSVKGLSSVERGYSKVWRDNCK